MCPPPSPGQLGLTVTVLINEINHVWHVMVKLTIWSVQWYHLNVQPLVKITILHAWSNLPCAQTYTHGHTFRISIKIFVLYSKNNYCPSFDIVIYYDNKCQIMPNFEIIAIHNAIMSCSILRRINESQVDEWNNVTVNNIFIVW